MGSSARRGRKSDSAVADTGIDSVIAESCSSGICDRYNMELSDPKISQPDPRLSRHQTGGSSTCCSERAGNPDHHPTREIGGRRRHAASDHPGQVARRITSAAQQAGRDSTRRLHLKPNDQGSAHRCVKIRSVWWTSGSSGMFMPASVEASM